MIPVNDGIIKTFKIENQTSRTYGLNTIDEKVVGHVNGLGSIEQAVYKILNTERYKYPIYSWNYGIEISDLFGMSASYVYSELKRRIYESLMWDERITNVDNFSFAPNKNKGEILITFNIHTIEGDFDIEKVVNI